jgi:hypothetical protein
MLFVALVIAPVVAAASCAPQLTPIRVPQHNLGSASAELTPKQMAKAVSQGCIAAGWGILSEAPGQTVAQVVSGGHSATVTITHSGSHYIIEHRESSPGLGYNGTAIHHRYNFWIDRLDRAIKNEIAKIHGAG